MHEFACIDCQRLWIQAVHLEQLSDWTPNSPSPVDLHLGVVFSFTDELDFHSLWLDFYVHGPDDVMTLCLFFHLSVCADRTRRARSVWAMWRGCSTFWSAGWGSPCWWLWWSSATNHASSRGEWRWVPALLQIRVAQLGNGGLKPSWKVAFASLNYTRDKVNLGCVGRWDRAAASLFSWKSCSAAPVLLR